MAGSNPIKHLQPHRHSLITLPAWHPRGPSTPPPRVRTHMHTPAPTKSSNPEFDGALVEVWMTLVNFNPLGGFLSKQDPVYSATDYTISQHFCVIKILVSDFYQNPSDMFYCSLESPGSCISNERRRTMQRKGGQGWWVKAEREKESERRRRWKRMAVLRRMGREKQMIRKRGRKRRRRRRRRHRNWKG